MSSYNEIEGDLIQMTKNGDFDVITHGCNCFSNMGAGIAVAMKNNFRVSYYPLENSETAGDINKLGQIDYQQFNISPIYKRIKIGDEVVISPDFGSKDVWIINSYTQYKPSVILKPLDYEALTLCMRKINHRFKGLHIGLPKIGAGLAGGDWEKIKSIIKTELCDCDVTIVIYKK